MADERCKAVSKHVHSKYIYKLIYEKENDLAEFSGRAFTPNEMTLRYDAFSLSFCSQIRPLPASTLEQHHGNVFCFKV